MTKVVIVGEIYNADLSIGGGPIYPPAGGGGPVDPGYSPPWVCPTPPHPSHPWVPPGPGGGPVDPGYSPPWARPQPPHPDQGLPGNQPYPDNSLPGSQPRPDQGLPPFPSHPIYIGPPMPAPEPESPVKWHAAWTPATGWVTVGIVVPSSPAPTPSTE